MSSGAEQDTIVAISTPPGRGGIGIVRLSGAEACVIAAPLLRLRQPLAHAQARFGHLVDLQASNSAAVLDQVIATYFAQPNSYTSEDVLEIASHGSPVILDHLLQECVARGARLAEPGEFTQRAFLSGRLDLTQAEAVHDLIESTTLQQARLAASQLGGSLSREIAPAKLRLIQLIAALEAGIDFAEDDIDLIEPQEITNQIDQVLAPLAQLQKGFAYGRLVREGFSLAIVGRPNAGKSSLFNALLQRDRAIVTSAPGTTRDPITERVLLGGIPVELIDTAGIRRSSSSVAGASEDPIAEAENLGMIKSKEVMADASCLLVVLDASQPLHPDDLSLLRGNLSRPMLIALNKCDLLRDVNFDPCGRTEESRTDYVRTQITALLQPEVLSSEREPLNHLARILQTSSLTRIGISELRDAIYSMMTDKLPAQDTLVLTNLRQYHAISGAIGGLEDALIAIRGGLPHEMLIISLQHALEQLDRLTGQTTSGDILNLIFSRFCIGK